MPAYRITYYWAEGIDGWSESIHSTLTDTTQIANQITAYTSFRLPFLSSTVKLLQVRLSDDLRFRDVPIPIVFPGVIGQAAGDALPAYVTSVIRLSSGDQFLRYLYCRGLPRVLITGRRWNATSAFWQKLLAFVNFLKNNNFAIFAKSSPESASYVTAWDSVTGVFTVAPAIAGLAPNKNVVITQVPRSLVARRQFRVVTAPDTTHFTLAGWPTGVNVAGFGRVRLADKVLQPINRSELNDVSERKIGRPFGLLRGRAPKVR